MKTLKFMLAAATAIGLASATQADEYNTTGFEKLAVGTSVTTGVEDNRTGYSYFYYAGANVEDNESVITNGTPNVDRPRGVSAVDATRNNILQVSTGTDPLLRTYAPLNGSTPQAASPLAGDTYVDTLVQFTVTPYTDTVTPSNGVDKLMIYLKESTNEVEGVTQYSTNLVVVGKYHDVDSIVKEYKVDGLVVEGSTVATVFEPNKWYRLTVKVLKNVATTGTYPGFMVYIDGKLCVFDSQTANMNASTVSRYYRGVDAVTAKQVVLSLLADGTADASLQGVGFAGEGKVDDIVFSDLNPFATIYDFTFSFDNTKISAIEYTVGGTSYTYARAFPEVEAGTEVQIRSISYAEGWQAGSTNVVNMTAGLVEGLYTVTGAGAEIEIIPAEAPAAAADWEADPTQITDNTPAATQYPTLAGTALATADAKKLTVWATQVANVEFSDVVADADDYVDAYLLNCAVADVDDEKDAFVANITFVNGLPVVTPPPGKEYNGTLQMRGSNNLSTWTDVSAASTDYKFYKFELGL